MPVQQTSVDVYYSEIIPSLGPMLKKIYRAFKCARYPVTDREIAYYLGWEINQVTGRRNDLLKAGIIEKCEKRICKITKRKVLTWYLKK